MSRTHITAMGLLLACAGIAAGQVLPDCGGEGERSCHPFDKEFWSMDSLVCEYDLKLRGTKCKNNHRWTNAAGGGWIAWAMHEQRDNLQGTLPINWATTFGTHNSFSSIQQGFVHYLAANQYLSITDQLEAGARFLRLDPHWYYDNLRLCHGENKHQCATTAPGRLFAMGIKEIANWLQYHDEVIFLEIHDSDEGEGDNPSEHPEYVLRPIKEYFGDIVFKPGDWPQGQTDWPSLNQLRTARKKVVVFGRHQYSETGDNYYSKSTTGTQWFFDYGSNFPQNDSGRYEVDQFDPASCSTVGISDTRLRGRKEWWFLGEGRTGSDVFKPTGLLDEPQVASATACGVSNLGVDFLLSRDKVLEKVNFAGNANDQRRESMIWSWREGEYGNAGPAVAKLGADPRGRWFADTPLAIYRFGCGRRSDVNYPWKITEWKISDTSGLWYDGDTVCGKLNNNGNTGWVFASPRTAAENLALKNTITAAAAENGVWLKYAANPVPEPIPSPAYFSFDMVRGGAVSPDQTAMLFSSPNVLYSASNVETRPFLKVTPLTGTSQPTGVPIRVGLDPARIPSFGAGSYPDSLAFTRTNSPMPIDRNQPEPPRRPGFLSAHLHIYEPTTTTVALRSPSPAVPAGTPVQIEVTVSSPQQTVNDYTTGLARLVRVGSQIQDGVSRQVILQEWTQQLNPKNNLVSSAVFSLSLPPGMYEFDGGYLGDDKHVESFDSVPLKVKIVTAPKLSPSTPVTISYVIGDPAPPAIGFQTTEAMTGDRVQSSWQAKLVTPSSPTWLTVAPKTSFGTLADLQTAAIAQIGPGYLDAQVTAARLDAPTLTVSNKVRVKAMVPAFDRLPASLDVTTGVFYRQDLWFLTNYVTAVSATATTDNGQPWLKVTTSDPNRTYYATVSMDPTGMAPGTYKGTLRFTSAFLKQGTVLAPVTMTVKPAVKVLLDTNITDSGIAVRVNGERHSLPYFFYSVSGAQLTVEPDYTSNSLVRVGFVSWGDGGAQKHTITVGANGATLLLKSWRDYHAQTAVGAGSGTVVLSPQSADGFYREGTVITVHAQPRPGWMFLQWTGALRGSNPTTTLTVHGVHNIQANFWRP